MIRAPIWRLDMNINDAVSSIFLPSLSLLNAARKFNTVAVVMYHNITDDDAPSYRSIRIRDFRNEMRYLKEKCEVITIADLVKIYQNPSKLNKTSRPRVVISVDDGFRDNYTNAFPILKEFGLPAAFFITTKDIHWEDELNGTGQRKLLNLNEMKEMRNHGMTFCSHTYSHPNLTRMGYEDQKMEIRRGMEELYERITDPEVRQVFAYPFGEYNQLTLEILKELKFKLGLTVWHHLNGAYENPLRLKRMTADGRDNLLKFACQLNPYVFKAYEWFLERTSNPNPRQKHSLKDMNSFVFEI